MKTTIHPEGVRSANLTIDDLPLRSVAPEVLSPPPDVRVLNLPRQSLLLETEQTLFGEVFSMPVYELVVNDRYLYDQERIVNRLGAYVALADSGGALQRVIVHTQRAGQHGTPGTTKEQDAAIHKLQQLTNAKIEFKYSHVGHDRYVLLTRTDGTQARILVGRGLDFISRDGQVLPTYVVIEDPL